MRVLDFVLPYLSFLAPVMLRETVPPAAPPAPPPSFTTRLDKLVKLRSLLDDATDNEQHRVTTCLYARARATPEFAADGLIWYRDAQSFFKLSPRDFTALFAGQTVAQKRRYLDGLIAQEAARTGMLAA